MFLHVRQGLHRGQVLPIPDGQTVTLGRSAQASYAFEDLRLSRQHCAVEIRAGLCRVVDLNSRNGTFLNGQRIGAALLRPGDRLQIGEQVLELCLSPEGTPRHTPKPSRCEACGEALRPGGGFATRDRVVCRPCFDRFDVDPHRIEGFTIRERIPGASLGETFLADQHLLNRQVVLRTIPAGPDADVKSLRRLLREAKAGGRLDHPAIVGVYDVNEHDGLLYLVLEHVPGAPLSELIARRGLLPEPQALRILLQVGEGLAYAHAREIVHRDVTPFNVVVRHHDGHAKLQGFTLSKNLQRAGLSAITSNGETLGSPFYMAPEQLRDSAHVDARADIYAWAATAYHALSGRRPVEAASLAVLIQRTVQDDPPPLTGVTPELSQALAHCLRQDPARRPTHLEDVLEILRALTPLPTPPDAAPG